MVDRGARGDLAPASREVESKVELAFVFIFALGMGRRHAVPLVCESPGVEWRELRHGRGVHEEKLVARCIGVDEGRELLNPLRYEESEDSDQDVWVELLVETEGITGRSSRRPQGICYVAWQGIHEGRRHVGCGPLGVMPGIYCVCSGRV